MQIKFSLLCWRAFIFLKELLVIVGGRLWRATGSGHSIGRSVQPNDKQIMRCYQHLQTFFPYIYFFLCKSCGYFISLYFFPLSYWHSRHIVFNNIIISLMESRNQFKIFKVWDRHDSSCWAVVGLSLRFSKCTRMNIFIFYTSTYILCVRSFVLLCT